MDREPAAPKSTSRSPPNHSGSKGQDAESKEVRIVRPSQDGERRHRQEDDHQTPEVDRARRRMPASTFRSQHRHNPRDSAHEPRRDMDRDDAEEQRRRRRNGDAKDDNALIGHGVDGSG